MKVKPRIVSSLIGFAFVGVVASPFAIGHFDYNRARKAQRYAEACEIGTGLARNYERIGLAGRAASWLSTAEADCSISRLQALR